MSGLRKWALPEASCTSGQRVVVVPLSAVVKVIEASYRDCRSDRRILCDACGEGDRLAPLLEKLWMRE